MPFQIKIARTDSDIRATYPVMRQLRPNVPRSKYLELVRLQGRKVGFQLAVLRDDSDILCVAGFRFCYSLGWGKFLYIDDLVSEKKRRSRGAGSAMFRWLVELAREEKCDELRLDSALYRHEAQRFYLRERMDIACFNFRLGLRKNNRETP